MNNHLTGFRRTLWQWDEYLRVARLVVRLLIANQHHTGSVEEKIEFGSHRRQYTVLHYHEEFIGQNRPVVFFLHGGGWHWGNPDLYRFVAHFFVKAGYPVILGGYRHTPRHKFPCQLDDACDGLAAGLKLASSLGLRNGSVILAGQSAGAQLASLMLLKRDNLQRHGLSQESFAGLLLISGLLDFAQCRNWKSQIMLHDYVGKRENWDQANPVQFIRGDEAIPILCIHGERDMLVECENSISFVEKLNGSGEIYLAPNAYHTDLTSMFLDHTPATEVMLRWLGKVAVGSEQ
ncbi:MAG: alpha/beta hydrolase [Chloroflexota bacterium]